ncbi:MAG: outer rane efflux protein [Bryobacterales bacterium]|nr:outer rane efflux protein [Bryobacterales bacterium]
MNTRLLGWLLAAPAFLAGPVEAQVTNPAAPAQVSSAPLTLTLKDALARAETNVPQVLAALSDAAVAREDLVQARAGIRPQVSFRSDYLGTQGNGVFPSGRFVTNDGVHVYRDWAVLHQDFTAAFTRTGPERAAAAEALARAKADVARRGLVVTVTRAYYGLLAAQRKYATAQQALDQAKRYFDISQSLERGGEVAHSDVVRAELQYTAQEQAFREAKLAMDTARLDLAVLLFRDFDQNFTVVDDLAQSAALPEYAEIQKMAARENPDLRAATSALLVAKLDTKIARQAYLPSLTADMVYGIEANAFALHSTVAAAPEKGPQPNLGYFLTVSLNVPLWDWGSRSSRVRAAEVRREQANVELSVAQRTILRNLQGFYQEAQTAREQLASLQRSVDLSAENLRLNGLRYQAGEATILELVDAQTAVTQARNAYEDGLVRYRLALANVQTLTGIF